MIFFFKNISNLRAKFSALYTLSCVMCVIMFIAIASCNLNANYSTEVPVENLNINDTVGVGKTIIGAYLPSSFGEINENSIDFKYITHVFYSFAHIDKNRIVNAYEYDSLNFVKLNKLKSIYPDLKIMVSVGGWTGSGGFSEMAANESNRKCFVNSVKQYLIENKLDGIDIDWEYPGIKLNNNKFSSTDGRNFTLLLKELRTTIGEGYSISVAAGAFQAYINNTEMIEIQKYADFINLMTYDYNGAWSSITGHHTNLYASALSPKGLSVDKSVKIFLAAGVPSEKIVIGAAFYSRGWSGVGHKFNGRYQQASSDKSLGMSFYLLNSEFLNKQGYVEMWDTTACAPYLWNESEKKFISYDNEKSVSAKCDYVVENELGGIMFWQYYTDYNSKLKNTIGKKLSN